MSRSRWDVIDGAASRSVVDEADMHIVRVPTLSSAYLRILSIASISVATRLYRCIGNIIELPTKVRNIRSAIRRQRRSFTQTGTPMLTHSVIELYRKETMVL